MRGLVLAFPGHQPGTHKPLLVPDPAIEHLQLRIVGEIGLHRHADLRLILRTGDDPLPGHLDVVGILEQLGECPCEFLPLRHGVGRGGRRRQNIDIGIEWIVDGLQMLQLFAVLEVKPGFDQLKQLAELLTLPG